MAKRRATKAVSVGVVSLDVGAPAPDRLATGEMASVLEVADGPASTPESGNREKVREFLAQAKRRFKMVADTESAMRDRMLEDLRFASSDQWDPQTKAERITDKRPIITINRIAQFCRQVTNAQRAANLAVKITPVDDGADVKTAEVLQGLIRHIEYQSDAPVAYSTAGESQVKIGRGYWTLDTEYEHDRSFVQGIRIKRVRNPFSIFMDPSAMELDGSDARFGFEVEDVPKDEYRVRFGNAAMASLEEFTASGGMDPDWMPEGKVKIARYWYVDHQPKTLLLIRWPSGHEEAITDDELDLLVEGMAPEAQPSVVDSRPVTVRTVKRALINAVEILEGNEDKTEGRTWPGRWIPIVPVIGDEIDINGKLDLRGMVYDAKDPQRLYNYQNTALAETLALVPKAPFIGAEGQFEGHEEKWKQANRRNFPYLEYKPVSLDGKLEPPPQRSSAGADIGAIMTAIQQSDQDLKATMGLFEPSLGIRQESGQSGKAIQALQKQGEQANSNFLDNMSRAIRFTGRIIVDLAPHIYDAPRILRIIGDDDEQRQVMVHAKQDPAGLPDPMKQKEQGIEGVFDLSIGHYDVIASSGPSLATKRDQALQALTTFVQAYPDAFPALGDLIVKNLDWPGAQSAAKRLRALMPPQLQQLLEQEEGQSIESLQAQVQQLLAQLEQSGMAIQELQQVIQTKKLETDAKVALEMEKMKADVVIAQLKGQIEVAKLAAKGEQDAQITLLEAQLDAQEQIRQMAHERAMLLAEHAESRKDAMVTRIADREDAAAGRTEDRTDAVMTRIADREDADRTRQADRVDNTVNRVRDREDAREAAAREAKKPKPPSGSR